MVYFFTQISDNISMMNQKEKQMFVVVNSETNRVLSFANRPSQFPYHKVAVKYAAMANRYGYHDSSNHYVVMSVAEFNATEDVRVTRKYF